MADEMRAMLDQLMGKDRDVPLDQRVIRRKSFHDPEVCKHALGGLCPYGLFLNTKSDLGPCEFEIHEDHLDWDAIKQEYDGIDEREKERYGYERSLLRLLQRLVAEMDRKIEKAQERANLEARPKPLKPDQQAEVDGLRAQAKALTERSEKLAEEGDVDGSMAAVAQADRLKGEADKLVARYSAPDRFLEVCEVCGLFIQSTDSEARRRDHLEGKQYLGWLAIREKLKELQHKYLGGGGPPMGGTRYPLPAGGPPLDAHRETEEGEVREERRGGSRGPEDHRERDRGRDRERERRRSRSRSRERRRYDDRRYDDRDRRGGGGGYRRDDRRGGGYGDRRGY